MPGINKVILVGHIGKKLDLRRLADEVPVLSFPFATSEMIGKNGDKTEKTEWHNIIMWRGLAESAFRMLKKGSLVYLEGKARTRSFTDHADIRKYSTEIIVDHFTLLGRKSDFGEES